MVYQHFVTSTYTWHSFDADLYSTALALLPSFGSREYIVKLILDPEVALSLEVPLL